MVTTPNYDLDIDTTLGGNNASDYVVPSQKAIKAYVDNSTGGNVMWGNIAGNISNQTDLQDALDDKQDALVSGSNIKTINSTSLLGSGNILVATSAQGALASTALQPNDNITELTNNANYITSSALAPYALSADLATVATSGSYNDLSDKPTIPAAQVNSDWNAISGKAQILNKPTLAIVATSGSYNDLSNKPTIPSEVTESTVSGWGFTKNTGTVTSVNNIAPVNGNVTVPIPDTATWGNISGTLSNQTDLQTALNGKQATLVSGTNIKTINNNSILGSGNLTLDGLPSQTGKAGKFLQTDGTDASWESAPFRNIGEIVSSTIPLTDAGLHLLDGSLIQGSGIYSAFVDYIAGLDLTANYFCTEAEWQASVTQYGVCGKFVYDGVNNTVRLPKYSNKIYTKDITSTAPVVGNGLTLGILHNETPYGLASNSSYNLVASIGAYGQPHTGVPFGNLSGSENLGVTPDPTKSGIEAQLSDITTSLDGYYYIVIATSTKTDIEVDIDEIATDLNGKADVDLSNISASQSAKNEIVSWGMPDYANGIVVSVANNSETSYTCPSKGVVIVNVTSGGNASSAYIKINDITVGMDRSWSGNNLNVCNAYLTVNNGDVIKARSSMVGDYSTDLSFIKFFPMEGAN